MRENLLRIVGPDDNADLRVIDNGEESYIVTGDIIVSEKTSSPYRPLHCSEIAEKMKKRNYQKGDTKFISRDSNGDLTDKLYSRIYEKVKPSGIIDLMDTQTQDNNYSISCVEESVSQEQISEVEQLYEKLFGAMKEQEVSFYSLPKKAINITSGSVVVDLVNAGSSEYTDTVSLAEVLKFPVAPIESGRVDVGIQYSKGSDIYSIEKTFTAFSYNDTTLMSMNNFVEPVNEDVQIEVINGDIKVSPINNEVNECIINNCTLIYGRN